MSSRAESIGPRSNDAVSWIEAIGKPRRQQCEDILNGYRDLDDAAGVPPTFIRGAGGHERTHRLAAAPVLGAELGCVPAAVVRCVGDLGARCRMVGIRPARGSARCGRRDPVSYTH